MGAEIGARPQGHERYLERAGPAGNKFYGVEEGEKGRLAGMPELTGGGEIEADVPAEEAQAEENARLFETDEHQGRTEGPEEEKAEGKKETVCLEPR